MKSLSALLLGAALVSPVLSVAVQAQPTPAPTSAPAPSSETQVATTVPELIAQLKAANPADRKAIIEAAVARNPNLAGPLSGALVTNFPADAAAFTKVVVDAVVALKIDTAAKSDILVKIAQTAVVSALQLPPNSVTDLVATVNGVKDALANVPAEFKPAVAAYVTPVGTLSDIKFQLQNLQNVIGNLLNPTSGIVSGSSLNNTN